MSKENVTSEHKAMLSVNCENEWYVDSGASSHMTPNKALLSNQNYADIKDICAANSSRMKVNGFGEATFQVNDGEVKINDVLHVPDLAVNLLSVHKIVSKGNTVVFNDAQFSIIKVTLWRIVCQRMECINSMQIRRNVFCQQRILIQPYYGIVDSVT